MHLNDLMNIYYSMSFAELYRMAYDAAVDQLLNFNFALGFAFVGAMFYVVTYYMKTMVPLRIVGIIGNLFFIAYGYFYPSYLTLILYLSILPINFYRLIEMRRLIEQVKESSNTDQSMDWLKPFMTKRTYKKGTVLFRKNERAYEMVCVVGGKFLVSESGRTIPAGQCCGEPGPRAPGDRRQRSL